MKYLNSVLNKKVEPQIIKIRKGNKKDIEGSPIGMKVSIPKYVITNSNEQHSSTYAHSDMELVYVFSKELDFVTPFPVEVELNFKSNPKLYPYRCPKVAIESIVKIYNKAVAPYNIPIENFNIFYTTPRARKVLTDEMAQEIIEGNKNR